MKHLFSLTGNYDKKVINKTADSREHSYGDLTELMIIIGKSLVNDETTKKLSIDISRLKEELILWKYYRKEDIRCFLLRHDEPEESCFVSSGIISILPLVIGNPDFNILEQEIARFSHNTKQNADELVLFLLMGKLVNLLMLKEINKGDSFIKQLKEYLIHLDYIRVFQEIPEKNRIDKISFEKSKIQWIMDIDRVSNDNIPQKTSKESYSKIIFIQSLHIFWKHQEEAYDFKLLENLQVSKEAKIFSLLLKDLKNNKRLPLGQITDKKGFDPNEKPILREMDRYFNRLKNFEIKKDFLNLTKVTEHTLTTTKALFSMEKDEEGMHPVLNRFRIHQKEIRHGYLYLEVETKSGCYLLKKPLAKG